MERETVVLITLVVYQLLLLGIGWLASLRTRSQEDFFLGGRALGPLVAAISASASSSSVWTLLGVSGFAYKVGLSALWLFPSCVGGFLINWYLIAPRLRRHAAETGAITLTDVLAGPRGRPGARKIRWLATCIILACLMTYVASQFEGAGKTFAETFDMSREWGILLGSAIVVAYTLLGGFWAVSLTDTLQGLLMAGAALVLPIAACYEVGGLGALWQQIDAVELEGYTSLIGNRASLATGVGFILGLFGIGLGYPGQPHVVNRFMALRDHAALRAARRYAILWAVVVFAGMITLGLAGRCLVADLGDRHESIFLVLTNQLFSPVVSGIIIAAVISALMSTADSQLLVAASSVTHDLDTGKQEGRSILLRSRLMILGLSGLAVLSALYASEDIFNKVLFAFNAIGAAFGPLLVVILWRGPVSVRRSLAAILSGFCLAVLFYSLPEFEGLQVKETWVERVLPYLVSGAIALWPNSRRSP